jgi:hypothetical protein
VCDGRGPAVCAGRAVVKAGQKQGPESSDLQATKDKTGAQVSIGDLLGVAGATVGGRWRSVL